MILRNKRSELFTAAVLMAPFIIIYGVLFLYPTVKMVQVSFTDAPLIGDGQFNGVDNFIRLWKDRLFATSIWNTLYFVLLSVIPGTILALIIAMLLTGGLGVVVERFAYQPLLSAPPLHQRAM